MRFRLRTLLIALALLPPLFAGTWLGTKAALDRYRDWQLNRQFNLGGHCTTLIPIIDPQDFPAKGSESP